MNDDVKAAAERYRKHQQRLCEDEHHKSPYWLPLTECWSERRLEDANVLANAHLTEHPADDDEPVTEEWLRSIGFKDWPEDNDDKHLFSLFIRANEEIGWECRLAYQTNGFYAVRMCDVDVHLGVAESVELLDSRNKTVKVTRGDVRRLCAALKIELKERT